MLHEHWTWRWGRHLNMAESPQHTKPQIAMHYFPNRTTSTSAQRSTTCTTAAQNMRHEAWPQCDHTPVKCNLLGTRPKPHLLKPVAALSSLLVKHHGCNRQHRQPLQQQPHSKEQPCGSNRHPAAKHLHSSSAKRSEQQDTFAGCCIFTANQRIAAYTSEN
jgi:hypothetical protein